MVSVPSGLDVWVLAGQSNMEGAGYLEGCPGPDERVFSFTPAGNWEVAEHPLHRPWESFTPIHRNLARPYLPEDMREHTDAQIAEKVAAERLTGVGPGLSFGKAMADALGRPIGLIPCSHGGVTLEQWSWRRKSEGGASLYGAMLERISRAGGNLRGVLWYQGESDCTPEFAPTYASRLDEWIAALRRDTCRPDLPFIAVQIGRAIVPGDRWRPEDWETVREAIRTLPERVPNTGVTTAVDLGYDDTLHVGTEGQIRLGRRLARLALSLNDDAGFCGGPEVVRMEPMVLDRGMGAVRVVCRNVTGGWKLKRHMSGFETRTADNRPHQEIIVVSVDADRNDPNSLRVLTNIPPDDSVYLGYGLGLNPYCNVVDEADMPLCAFLPRPIDQVH